MALAAGSNHNLAQRGRNAIHGSLLLRAILEEITEQAPDYLPAWRRLAQLAFAKGSYGESVAALHVIFKKHPSDLDGHLLRGRVHLAKRETTEGDSAIPECLVARGREPRFPLPLTRGFTLR